MYNRKIFNYQPLPHFLLFNTPKREKEHTFSCFQLNVFFGENFSYSFHFLVLPFLIISVIFSKTTVTLDSFYSELYNWTYNKNSAVIDTDSFES